MDRRDLQILKAIAEHQIDSPSKIHEETGIPESTIYYRLNNLREQGIIKNDLYDVDLEKLGLGLTIIIEVVATYKEDYHEKIGEKLSEIEGVSQVHFTMGERDFVVIAHVPNREEVERLIGDFEKIDEVQRTESKFTITTIKNEPRVIHTYSLDKLEETIVDNTSGGTEESEE
jgi:DNA-binding Lrp family transcriptional regulator